MHWVEWLAAIACSCLVATGLLLLGLDVVFAIAFYEEGEELIKLAQQQVLWKVGAVFMVLGALGLVGLAAARRKWRPVASGAGAEKTESP